MVKLPLNISVTRVSSVRVKPASCATDERIAVIGLTRSSDGASRAMALAPGITFISTNDPQWQEGVRAAAAGRPVLAIADCASGTLAGEVAELLQACIAATVHATTHVAGL